MNLRPDKRLNQTLNELTTQYPGLENLTFNLYVEFDGTNGIQRYSQPVTIKGISRQEISQSPAIQNTLLKDYLVRTFQGSVLLQPETGSACDREESVIKCTPARLVFEMPATTGFEALTAKSYGVPMTSPIFDTCYYTLPVLTFSGNVNELIHAEGKIVSSCQGEPISLFWSAGGTASISNSFATINFNQGEFEQVRLKLNQQDAATGISAMSNETVILSADLQSQHAGDGSGVAWVRLITL